MSAPQGIDVQQLIDEKPLSKLQILVIALCFLIVFVDGYDAGVIGFVAPALIAAWDVPPEDLRFVVSAALFGLAIGALAAGPLADRFGRKPILVGSVFFFGLCSLLSAFADDPASLATLRLLTGLGLGAAMPNATTLTAEYCPARQRSFLVTLMFCGFTLGAASAGLLGGRIVPAYGWQSAFWVGGLVPIALAIALCFLLPESLLFLVLRREGDARTARIVKRISPAAPIAANTNFFSPESVSGARSKMSIRVLFQDGYGFGTLALWLAYFMGLLVIFLIRSWLPTFVSIAGESLERAAVLGAMFDIGGTLGALLVAWCMDKYHPHRAIALSYILGASAIVIVAQVSESFTLLASFIFIAGFFLSGSQTSLSPLAAAFYPTRGRATGVAWMLGVGRFGGILGALSGGVFLGLGWDFATILSALAAPTIIAALAILYKSARYARDPARRTNEAIG